MTSSDILHIAQIGLALCGPIAVLSISGRAFRWFFSSVKNDRDRLQVMGRPRAAYVGDACILVAIVSFWTISKIDPGWLGKVPPSKFEQEIRKQAKRDAN